MNDDVDNATIGKLIASMLYIISEDDAKDEKEKNFTREPIKFYINSFGGSAVDMWSLISIIEQSQTPIHTYCTGYAMSAGFKLFLAGHKRFMSKRAVLLYHQLAAGNKGKYQDMLERQEHLEHQQKMVEDFLLSKTKITQKKLTEIRERKIDWYIYADQAIELGCADEII